MPQHALHNIKALAVLGSRGAACVAQVVDGVQRHTFGVKHRGHTIKERVSTTVGIPVQGCSTA